MENDIRERLLGNIFRMRKAGAYIPPGVGLHASELFTLARIDHSCDGVTVAEIQNGLHVTKPAVSQILSSLENKGYITRQIDPSDKRKFIFELTQSGRELSEKMKLHHNSMLDEIITRFGEDKTNQLIDLFEEMIEIWEQVKNERTSQEGDGKND